MKPLPLQLLLPSLLTAAAASTHGHVPTLRRQWSSSLPPVLSTNSSPLLFGRRRLLPRQKSSFFIPSSNNHHHNDIITRIIKLSSFTSSSSSSYRVVCNFRGGGATTTINGGDPTILRKNDDDEEEEEEEEYQYGTIGFLSLKKNHNNNIPSGAGNNDEESEQRQQQQQQPFLQRLLKRYVQSETDDGMVAIPSSTMTKAQNKSDSTTTSKLCTTLVVGTFPQKNTKKIVTSETMGTLCDLIIVSLDYSDDSKRHNNNSEFVLSEGKDDDDEDDVLKRLVSGAERRLLSTGGSKSNLIVLAQMNSGKDDDEDEEEEEEEMMTDYVSRRMGQIKEDTFDTFEIWTYKHEEETLAALEERVREVLEEVVLAEEEKKDVPLRMMMDGLVKGVYESIVQDGGSGSSERNGGDGGDGDDTVVFHVQEMEVSENEEEGAATVEVKPSTTTTTLSKVTGDDDAVPNNPQLQTELTQLAEDVLSNAELQMEKLESKMDEVLLDATNKVPILEFGTDADEILRYAVDAFDALLKSGNDDVGRVWTEVERGIILEKQQSVLKQISGSNDGILRLFQQQLQSLREHYGRQYESVLDEITSDEHNTGGTEGRDDRRAKRDAMVADAAKRATESFRVAAENAIPSLLCRAGEKKNEFTMDDGGGKQSYEIVDAMDGLLRDMMEATSLREEMEEEWDAVTSAADVEEDSSDVEEEEEEENGRRRKKKKKKKRRRGVVKWYEKLAARAVVLAVNYLQGWLALQAMRKAAAERDRNMPKFPLF